MSPTTPTRPFSWAILSGLLSAAACGPPRETPPRESVPASAGNEAARDDAFAPAEQGIVIELSAEPEVHLGGRPPVVHVAITNTSVERLEVGELEPELQIDGQPAMRLDLGSRGVRTIGPGETVEFDQNLGVRLLPPGEHQLRLDIGESHSAPIRILVTDE